MLDGWRNRSMQSVMTEHILDGGEFPGELGLLARQRLLLLLLLFAQRFVVHSSRRLSQRAGRLRWR